MDSIRNHVSPPHEALLTHAHIASPDSKYAISSMLKDLVKNTALAYMRLEPLLDIALQYRMKVIEAVENNVTLQV